MTTPRRITVTGLLVALAAGATWVGHEYRTDIGRARARVATGSQVLSTPCGPIEYAETGSGPAVLAIHGAGGGFDQGLSVGAPLAARGYRVIAMSRFGYLRTPAPPHPSVALQADAHACLLDALKISSTPVISVSAGAPSALEFALRYPERCKALVLLVPGWYPEAGTVRRMGSIERLVVERALRSDFIFWAITRFLRPLADSTVLGTPHAVVTAASPSEQARLAAVLASISPISPRQVGLSLEAQLTTERLSQPLESLTAPTLAISLQDDLYGTYANAQFIARRIPNCKFIGYPTGGHMWVGHNDEVIAAVLEFLKAAPSPQPFPP